MRRMLFAAAALAGALLIAFLASIPPAVQPISAPAAEFSAGRAMADVRAISQSPRPTGSVENARARAYLAARMRELGMKVGSQAGPLPAASAEKLRKRGSLAVAPSTAVNLIGLLPGRDPSRPAVLLMAHYDSVPHSPGAPDDAAGVAAGLEIVRALKIQGQPARDVLLLLTDAEEAGLVGAKMFFAAHPLAGRAGAVINMESRGGGGRTAMFETGRGNAHWVELYRRSVARPFSNSLGVLIYELMPNSTDFTIPKGLGRPGFNFAFIGEAQFYHSPKARPEALDQRSLQDLGDQALSVSRALAFTPDLPGSGVDAVFGDVLGLFVIAYQPIGGWLILTFSAGLFGLACWRLRKNGELCWRDIAVGAVLTFALLLHIALLLSVENLISGSGAGSNYYDRLAALPRLELQAFLLCAAALLLAYLARRPAALLSAAAPALVLMSVGIVLAGWSPPILVLGLVAAVSAMFLPAKPISLWGSWVGLWLPLFLLALAVQFVVPTAGPLLHWPLLLAAIAAAVAASFDRSMERAGTLALLAVIAGVGGGQLLYLAHFTFLGVGAPIPETMTLYALLIAMLLWPLLQGTVARRRAFGLAALGLIVIATGLALTVRLDPLAKTIPPYSEKG